MAALFGRTATIAIAAAPTAAVTPAAALLMELSMAPNGKECEKRRKLLGVHMKEDSFPTLQFPIIIQVFFFSPESLTL